MNAHDIRYMAILNGLSPDTIAAVLAYACADRQGSLHRDRQLKRQRKQKKKQQLMKIRTRINEHV